MQADFVHPADETPAIPDFDRMRRLIAVHRSRALGGIFVGLEIGLVHRGDVVAVIEGEKFVAVRHASQGARRYFVPLTASGRWLAGRSLYMPASQAPCYSGP